VVRTLTGSSRPTRRATRQAARFVLGAQAIARLDLERRDAVFHQGAGAARGAAEQLLVRCRACRCTVETMPPPARAMSW
jgi:hypothetical protein